jgi:hypothetical protein
MKMGLRWKSWKNQTIYKIHESSKVPSFPAFWVHLLFVFLASIYCPAFPCTSIVCSPKFIYLPSSSVLSNVSLPWFHPLFHFTKFICSPTSAKLSQVHSWFHFLKVYCLSNYLELKFLNFIFSTSKLHPLSDVPWLIYCPLFQLIPF